MGEIVGVVITADTDPHPMRDLAGGIFGVNILRTPEDVAAAPDHIVEAFEKITTVDMPPYSQICACCGKPMRKAVGVAVIRLKYGVHPEGMPSVGMIPVGVCRRCMKKENLEITRQVVTTMTGVDPGPPRNWKDMLN